MYNPNQQRDKTGKWSTGSGEPVMAGIPLKAIIHAKLSEHALARDRLATHLHILVATQHIIKHNIRQGNIPEAQKNLNEMMSNITRLRKFGKEQQKKKPVVHRMADIKATQLEIHARKAQRAIDEKNPDLIHPMRINIPPRDKTQTNPEYHQRHHHLSLVRSATNHAQNLKPATGRDSRTITRQGNWEMLSRVHQSLASAHHPDYTHNQRGKHLDEARIHLTDFKDHNRESSHLPPRVGDEFRMHYEEAERGLRQAHRDLGLPPLASHRVGDEVPHHQNPEAYHDQWHRTLIHPEAQQHALSAAAAAYHPQVTAALSHLASAHRALQFANNTSNWKLRNPTARQAFLKEADRRLGNAHEHLQDLPRNQVHQTLKDALEAGTYGAQHTRGQLT